MCMFEDDDSKLFAEFNVSRMERFVKRDALLRRVVEDLLKKGMYREKALEIAFNGYVLEDSIMIREYERG